MLYCYWFFKMASLFISACSRDLKESQKQNVRIMMTEKKETRRSEIGAIFQPPKKEARVAKKIFEQFEITISGGQRTTEDVLGLTHDGKPTRHASINPNINSANFPLPKLIAGKRKLIAIEFSSYVFSEQAIEKARLLGFERPSYSDAFFFDEQFPNKKGWYVFLHEPWQYPGGYSLVVVLTRLGQKRRVRLFPFDDHWNRPRRFVFVRK